jgi:hypothetical protein
MTPGHLNITEFLLSNGQYTDFLKIDFGTLYHKLKLNTTEVLNFLNGINVSRSLNVRRLLNGSCQNEKLRQ